MSAMLENQMVIGLARHFRAEERRDARIEAAHTQLAGDYMAAAVTNPLLPIQTPGWGDDIGGRRQAPMIDILADQLAGVGSEAKWAELVGILSKSVLGMRWLKERAEDFATYHELDAAEDA